MNSEQLQSWLNELNERCQHDEKSFSGVERSRNTLNEESDKTNLLIAYVKCNYADIDLTQPIVAQLLACYYRGGVLRYFALQFVPSFIYIYLLALAKRQKRSVCMLETFFIAIYNEEILAVDTGLSSPLKKVEEIRIPSVRYPSVYHDPKKLTSTIEIMPPKSGTPAYVQMTVRIGPYDSVDRLIPENRQSVLTRLLKSVNSCLYKLAQDVVCRSLCLSTMALCQSGFSIPESDFRSRIFITEPNGEILDDISKKPRIHLSSQYLLEALNGVYFALFNGASELAIRSIDAIHQRAIFELYSDVILVTNSIRNSLLESVYRSTRLSGITDESNTLKQQYRSSTNANYLGAENRRKRSEMVTNASLRVKKMPEDISVVLSDSDDATRKESSSFVDGVEGLRKKIAMKIDHRKASGTFGYHRKKQVNQVIASSNLIEISAQESGGGASDRCVGPGGEIELDVISEEARQTDFIVEHLADLNDGQRTGADSTDNDKQLATGLITTNLDKNDRMKMKKSVDALSLQQPSVVVDDSSLTTKGTRAVNITSNRNENLVQSADDNDQKDGGKGQKEEIAFFGGERTTNSAAGDARERRTSSGRTIPIDLGRGEVISEYGIKKNDNIGNVHDGGGRIYSPVQCTLPSSSVVVDSLNTLSVNINSNDQTSEPAESRSYLVITSIPDGSHDIATTTAIRSNNIYNNNSDNESMSKCTLVQKVIPPDHVMSTIISRISEGTTTSKSRGDTDAAVTFSRPHHANDSGNYRRVLQNIQHIDSASVECETDEECEQVTQL
ncbi:unnamed protein product [Anisakis simplex]|uniref:Hyccin n=1 Tax=Anisakis simplex TaxID=6269 RepID=A0A0M3JT61_ANISI|nr:unnamed protein product [Anisakis simplex]